LDSEKEIVQRGMCRSSGMARKVEIYKAEARFIECEVTIWIATVYYRYI
jgi:hypothetical protein